MIATRLLFRKMASISLFAAIGFTAVAGFGHAAHAETPSVTQDVYDNAPADSQGEKIINTGKKFLGVKYRFGAPSGVTYAFDCSSFTQYIYKQNGISLPRTSREQSTVGSAVKKTDLNVGDLVFFKSPGSAGIGHVGVYAGNSRMLHTGGAGGVKFSDINSTYYTKQYVAARRVLKTAEPDPALNPDDIPPPPEVLAWQSKLAVKQTGNG